MNRRYVFLGVIAFCSMASPATADTIRFGGLITQSTQDGTGPAVNNPSLNNILDGQNYDVRITFKGSITAPGTYDLTGAGLVFSDTAAPASESSFGSISLTIAPDAGFFDFSLLGCLTTGMSCAASNQLDANFQIDASKLNSPAVTPATGLDQPHPLDLLEDDGITDIQGTITSYSYTSVNTVPEPSSLVQLGGILAALFTARRNFQKRHQSKREEKDI